MNEFSLQLTQHARSDLEGLPVKIQKQIAQDIQMLPTHPFPHGDRIKKLKGFGFPLYRLRAGDFRVLYRVDGTQITVMRVIDRKMLEPVLRRMKLIQK